jgi:hypothetical protein
MRVLVNQVQGMIQGDLNLGEIDEVIVVEKIDFYFGKK